MPRLESQLNHREFKLKSELQIENWKKKSNAEKSCERVAKFQKGCEISQSCENLDAPVVDFFLYSFYRFQNCPYVIVILFYILENCI